MSAKNEGTVWGGPSGLVWVSGAGEDAEARFMSYMRPRTIVRMGPLANTENPSPTRDWTRKGVYTLTAFAPEAKWEGGAPDLVHRTRGGTVIYSESAGVN